MTRRWLIVGGSGMLGTALCEHLAAAGQSVVATTYRHGLSVPGIERVDLDLAAEFDAQELVSRTRPDVIVYAAGLTNVDACEDDEPLAYRLHADAARRLAAAADAARADMVYVSTDHLWGGRSSLVSEDEPVAPLNAYARTKAAGERLVLAAAPRSLLLRTNFFGRGLPWRPSLSDWMIERLRSGERLTAFTDAYFSPIAMSLLSRCIEEAVTASLTGIYHCCGRLRVSKYDFARSLAHRLNLPVEAVEPGRLADARLLAPRPADMSLSTSKIESALGRRQPDLTESLDAVAAEMKRRS